MPRRGAAPLMLGGVVLLVAGTALELSPVWTAGMLALLVGAIIALRGADRRIPRSRPGTGPAAARPDAPRHRPGPPPPRR